MTRATPRRARRRAATPKVIWLYGCGCPTCRGRAGVCMDAFDWLDKSAPDHALSHAQADLVEYFDRLPTPIKDALHRSDVNVCAWCASIWVERYGVAMAARLIGDVRYIDDGRAVTPLEGWGELRSVASHILPLAKSLDCDRAQAEASLAGAPHCRRYP